MKGVRTLNLDPEFIPVPYAEIEYKWINFPAGERQIRLNTDINYAHVNKVIITARYSKHVGDRLLMDIAIAVDALERQGVERFDLILPYFPHSRQDRVTVKGEAHTLRMFSHLLNSIPNSRGWYPVKTFDMHSLEGKIVSGVTNKDNFEFVKWVMTKANFSEPPILISPDAGAKTKSENIYMENSSLFNTISYCYKKRNPETGKLSGFGTGHPNYMGRPCIIIDDICDGGGTFIGLAQELKKANAGTLYLAVSHGIFSQGFGNLIGYPFAQIFTTNSYKRVPKLQKIINNMKSIHEYKLQW